MIKNHLIKYIFILSSLLIVGCEDGTWNNPTGPGENQENEDTLYLELDPRLDIDENGYYHLEIDEDSWQTLHRLSGNVYDNGEPVENHFLTWDATHYWYLNDTLGYIINQNLSGTSIYTTQETSYPYEFDGFEVPTVNSSSYSNSYGEFNTMIAPVRNMKTDTIMVRISYWNYQYELVENTFNIVLD